MHPTASFCRSHLALLSQDPSQRAGSSAHALHHRATNSQKRSRGRPLRCLWSLCSMSLLCLSLSRAVSMSQGSHKEEQLSAHLPPPAKLC